MDGDALQGFAIVSLDQVLLAQQASQATDQGAGQPAAAAWNSASDVRVPLQCSRNARPKLRRALEAKGPYLSLSLQPCAWRDATPPEALEIMRQGLVRLVLPLQGTRVCLCFCWVSKGNCCFAVL